MKGSLIFSQPSTGLHSRPLSGRLTGFGIEYVNHTNTGTLNQALVAGVKAAALDAELDVYKGSAQNHVGASFEGSVFKAEGDFMAGRLSGEDHKHGFMILAEGGAYGLVGEVTPRISIAGYRIGVTFGGSVGSAHIGAGLGAYHDTEKGTQTLKGIVHGGFITGFKFGFEITKKVK